MKNFKWEFKNTRKKMVVSLNIIHGILHELNIHHRKEKSPSPFFTYLYSFIKCLDINQQQQEQR